MSNVLRGKVALVTGGTSGLGLSVARQLAELGVQLVVAGRNQQQGQQVAQELSQQTSALFVATDVGQESQVKALVQQTLDQYGQIDFLFNNAGVEGTPGPLIETTEAGIDELLATNVKGVLLVLKHVLPSMLKQQGGIIVNTASFIGTVMPFPEAMPYGASKAAVLSITRAMAAGYGKDQIRTYAVCPWATDTPMLDRLAGDDAQVKAGFGSLNPSGQLVQPAEFAHVVVSLFRGEMDLANGEAVLVDSGSVSEPIHPMRFDKPSA